MLKTSLIFVLCLFTVALTYGQKDTLSKADKAVLDSMFKNDAFINLMKEKEHSFFDVRVGAGNQLLSTNNNNANAGESKSSFALIPSIAYTHKSGFGVAVSAFFASDSGQFKPYQFAINPYYEYYGRSFSAGLSYTRFIFNTSSNFAPNPFENDFYGNFLYTKTLLEPGLSATYDNGQYSDTTVSPTGVVRQIKIKLSDFSLTPYVQSDFSFYKLFSKNDGLSLTPAIMLVAGRQQAKAPGLNRIVNRPRLKAILKNRYEADSKFQLQSLAASVTIKYQFKFFYISPDIYLDYYLPSTTANRWTTVFSMVAGITF